eukprot:CAMPEP_0184680766 /NCGR_PEP_ID=MMETSP0312-20130426/3678_1 /TAXON_ID=31354 /ORGANISM="Compsopogon coeruleus, Strain SAG 36.94" /LENGTH=539 /DNA_ID=CAMNT_0027131105 /DNA_START=49 /DNA_END=1665 /DNA_ORIENTATION=-
MVTVGKIGFAVVPGWATEDNVPRVDFSTKTQRVRRVVPGRVRMGVDVKDAEKVPLKEESTSSSATQGSTVEPSLTQPAAEYRPSMLCELVEGLQETVEDVSLHLQRKYFTKKTDLINKKRKKLVILGSGWASHAMIKVVDNFKWDVQVVSPKNYFLFTPMLPSSSVGTVEFRSIVEPIRASNELVEYVEAKCLRIDPTRKMLICASGDENLKVDDDTETFEISYDQLVVAVGARTGTFGVEGAEQYCYFLKGIDDARRLRRAIVDTFEKANLDIYSEEEKRKLLTFVVVGGGPTGCEFAAELRDFLRNDLARFYPLLINLVGVKLLQSGDSILTQFDASLREQALENFRKSGIDVITNTRVIRVTKDRIYLRDGTEIPSGVCVWAAGNAPTNFARNLVKDVPEQASQKSGRILVDDYLRVVGLKDVFAIGDCSEVVSGSLPASAQVAAQQGAYLARLLNKYELDEEPPKMRSGNSARPFRFLSLGILAYIGSDQALVEIDLPGQQHLDLAGRLAFLLWRSVYLTKQVSTRNRVLVLADW